MPKNEPKLIKTERRDVYVVDGEAYLDKSLALAAEAELRAKLNPPWDALAASIGRSQNRDWKAVYWNRFTAAEIATYIEQNPGDVVTYLRASGYLD